MVNFPLVQGWIINFSSTNVILLPIPPDGPSPTDATPLMLSMPHPHPDALNAVFPDTNATNTTAWIETTHWPVVAQEP